MTRYCTSHGSRLDHIVGVDTTLCGKSLVGMAVWGASFGSRVGIRPLCEACRTAARASQ